MGGIFKRRGKSDTATFNLTQRLTTLDLLAGCARCLYRWRWQLLPAYVATAALPAAWGAAILDRTAGTGWLIAAYAVAAVCTGAWVLHLRRTYDRVLGIVTALAVAAFTGTIAVDPGLGAAYGVWALGWPILGLGWWVGPALRSGTELRRLNDKLAHAFAAVGAAGLRILDVRKTKVGRIVRVRLPQGATVDTLSPKRIDAALGGRHGASRVVRDLDRADVAEIHLTDVDPFAHRGDTPHPATQHLAAISTAATEREED